MGSRGNDVDGAWYVVVKQVRLKEKRRRRGDFGAENAGGADDNEREVHLSATPALSCVIS